MIRTDSTGTIHLKRGTVDPGLTKGSVQETISTVVGSTRHLLMQFGTMPGPLERQALAANGLKVLSYIPHRAFWVVVDETFELDGAEKAAGPITWAWSPTWPPCATG